MSASNHFDAIFQAITTNPRWLSNIEAHARTASLMSKDETKVGAVLFNERKHTLITAFNGPAHGVIDKEERRERPLKYKFAAHAEENLINIAAYNGICLEGKGVFATHEPCPRCASAMVQAGIKGVIVGTGKWQSQSPEDVAITASIFQEAHVKTYYLKVFKPEFDL